MTARVLAAVAPRLGSIDEHLPALDGIARALEPASSLLEEAPSARMAIETALLDLLGARLGLPAATLLSGSHCAHARVAVNALLYAEPAETLALRGRALAEAGFSAIKVKLRGQGDEGFARELSALVELRRALPLPFEIRLDPNGAWEIAEARRRLDALVSVAPRYVEQPVRGDELHRLGQCAVPWAADESLSIPQVRDELLASSACAVFVLKPAILGGLVATYDLARAAAQRGIDVVLTHLFDGPSTLAATSELAVSLPRPPLASGLDPHDPLRHWMAALGLSELPQLREPCFVRSGGAPGLGLLRKDRGSCHA